MASVPQSASRPAPFIRCFCALAVTWFAVWASGCSDLDRAQRARVLEVAARAKEDLRQFAMAEQDFVEAGVPADFSYTSDARLADVAALQQLRLAQANGAAEAEVALPDFLQPASAGAANTADKSQQLLNLLTGAQQNAVSSL